jgi:hypothetical protein
LGAEHDAVDPPPDPVQDHVQEEPASVKEVNVPVVHLSAAVSISLVAGYPCVFAVPQAPLTDDKLAEQDAFVPPLIPLQFHVQGPVPETAEAFPALQRLVVGAVENVPPFDDPQTPLINLFELQEAVVPPPDPVQLQV